MDFLTSDFKIIFNASVDLIYLLNEIPSDQFRLLNANRLQTIRHNQGECGR